MDIYEKYTSKVKQLIWKKTKMSSLFRLDFSVNNDLIEFIRLWSSSSGLLLHTTVSIQSRTIRFGTFGNHFERPRVLWTVQKSFDHLRQVMFMVVFNWAWFLHYVKLADTNRNWSRTHATNWSFLEFPLRKWKLIDLLPTLMNSTLILAKQFSIQRRNWEIPIMNSL